MPDAVPLYYAAFCGFYYLAEHLVKNPGHVNAKGGLMGFPLMAALRGKHYKVAELLFKRGANVNVWGKWEFTLLHFASRFDHDLPDEGRVDLVQWLLNHGADPNAQGEGNWIPLFLATGNGYFGICQLLQVHNADISVRTIDGETPLHRAASPFYNKGNQLKIMRLLLDQGADVDARNNAGRTPLHYSSFCPEKPEISGSTRGTVEGSRLLLEHGADIRAKDNEGKTALQLALENGHHEMAKFLLSMAAK